MYQTNTPFQANGPSVKKTVMVPGMNMTATHRFR